MTKINNQDIINQIRELFENIELFNRICSKFKINQFQYRLFESYMINYSFKDNGYLWFVECTHNLKDATIQDIFCINIMGDNHYNLELDFNTNRNEYYTPSLFNSILDIKYCYVSQFLNQIYDIYNLNTEVLEYPTGSKIDKYYFKKYKDFKIIKLTQMDIPQEKSSSYFGFYDDISFYCVVEKYWC